MDELENNQKVYKLKYIINNMKKQINITIDEEVLKILHKEKGLIPLSIYINDILKKKLNKNESIQT